MNATFVHEDNTFVEKKDRFGFIIKDGNEWYASVVKFKPNEVRLQNTRLEKWRAMMKKGLGSCSTAVLKRRVRKRLATTTSRKNLELSVQCKSPRKGEGWFV